MLRHGVILSFARNEQKKAKRARYETEKVYMRVLQDLGNTVGQYVGDGQGEAESLETGSWPLDPDVDADDSGVHDLSEQIEDSSDNAKPLFVLYDCESTGLSIYNDHIIEMAAEVVNSPVTCRNGTFSRLVKTSRRIPTPGIHHPGHRKPNVIVIVVVIKITNITPTMIRDEQGLSVVFPAFLDWLITTTSDISSASGTPHFPGLTGW